MDLKEEEILGDQVGSHWYYRAKAAALLSNLRGQEPKEILDIGAGAGFFSKILLKATGAERAVCVDTGYLCDRDEICYEKTVSFRRVISKSNADLVLAMDVIEHVSDDSELLRSYCSLVESGTCFIVSVPAFNFLWSGHDVFLEHHRRYTLATLRSAMQRSGLDVDWSHYYYATVFPIAAGVRLFERLNGSPADTPKSQLRRHGVFVNETFSAMLAVERLAMRANRLFGLTAFAGGHKP